MKKLLITISLFLAFQSVEAQYSNIGYGWMFTSTRQFNHGIGQNLFGVVKVYWNVRNNNIFEIHFSNGVIKRYEINASLNGPKKGYTGDGEFYTKVHLSNIDGSGYIGVQMVDAEPPYIRMHYGDTFVDLYVY
jgi:hypothetical protein